MRPEITPSSFFPPASMKLPKPKATTGIHMYALRMHTTTSLGTKLGRRVRKEGVEV